MTFDPNIPQPTDFISTSQAQVLINFSQVDTIFGIDHVKFSSGSAQAGEHNKVTFVQQGSDPTTGVNELALYSKAASGQPELFVRRASNGAVQQLTSPFGFSLDSLSSAAVIFDASGNIQGSAVNVSSVTKNSTGVFTINFTSALSTTNYWPMISANPFRIGAPTVPLTTSLKVQFISATNIAADPTLAYVIVFQV